MVNHGERRSYLPYIHILIAFNKTAREERANPPVIRKLIMYSLEHTLSIFRAQLKELGGEWRIHHTVNARDVEKARKYLLKQLIDHPEKAYNLEAEWRTALLQRECIYGDKKFMFDVDTKDHKELLTFEELLNDYMHLSDFTRHESPKGWHYITPPFDTREVCKLEYVTLLRDGYFYLETVNG